MSPSRVSYARRNNASYRVGIGIMIAKFPALLSGASNPHFLFDS